MYRENTKEIAIGNVKIGGTHPVTIQSMTNTKTENVKETVDQILRLERQDVKSFVARFRQWKRQRR